MNVESYRTRLLALEGQLGDRAERERAVAREEDVDSSRDAGDASVADDTASTGFSEAELDGAILEQVREALQRIDEGTFGRCLVDGGPIEPKRLDAVPWARYCLKHQTLLEAAARPRMPTL